ncbi:MBL fold metallo-hydrolase [Pseudoalteromonas sp. AOP31-A2-14]|uniref:MBL fold metallo-hydrolase n=1 Tax=Pseudoalteromonas sp. AOP31-A2-14 TaxID=3457695 RepID=UPI0040362702
MSSPFFIMLKKQLIVSAVIFISLPINAVTWQQITPHINFLQQPEPLRFYDSNQIVIEGDECALVFDASGDFSNVERMVVKLKKRLKTPLCYLVASHYHDDHLLGMAVLQHYFKDAKLIVHSAINAEFNSVKTAFTDKLDSYEQSIELSYQRLAEQPKEQQAAWRTKLNKAKKRLLRFRKYSLQPPAITVDQSLTLDLGNYPVELKAYQAQTNADLTLFASQEGVLLGGDIIDYLPYPGQGNLASWLEALKKIKQNKNIKKLLPGHGPALQKAQLTQPISFLQALLDTAQKTPEQSLEQLQLTFPSHFATTYERDEISKKIYPIFLQAGLKRAKTSNIRMH